MCTARRQLLLGPACRAECISPVALLHPRQASVLQVPVQGPQWSLDSMHIPSLGHVCVSLTSEGCYEYTVCAPAYSCLQNLLSCGLWTVLMLPPLPSCRALVLSLILDGKVYTIAIFKRTRVCPYKGCFLVNLSVYFCG